MASDETMMSSTIDSSFQDEEEEFEDDNIGDHHHHTNPHNLSRLSVCTTSSTMCRVEDDVDNLASMCMSHLCFEGGDNGGGGGGVEADGEFSDGKEEDNINYLLQTGGLSSDENYDELSGSCYSLPARKKNETQTLPSIGVKEYASENEAKKETKSKRPRRRRRRDTWVGEKENIWGVNSNEDKKKEKRDISSGGCGSNGTAAAGLMVITRPKGGNRSLCMDLEEVKACRDLGFELEHERMLEIINPPNPSSSSRLSFSNSTSSGGNSPIANWRISAPGDDPRDVKARLKMWAQAVALASASSKYSS